MILIMVIHTSYNHSCRVFNNKVKFACNLFFYRFRKFILSREENEEKMNSLNMQKKTWERERGCKYGLTLIGLLYSKNYKTREGNYVIVMGLW